MGDANAGGWGYTARYGWNWRSARAMSGALGSLALPMPPWLRAVVARCLLTRIALHADAEGIRGSAGSPPTGMPGPCPWKDVTDIVVWDYHHLRIIGLARRGDAVGGGPAARALASRAHPQSRPPRRRALRRHPSYSVFIAPDGSPYDAANVVTANDWCVDTAWLQATVRHFAPHARFVDLSGGSVGPESGGPFGFAFEVLAGLAEPIGWRRLGWLLAVAAAAAVLAVAAANLGTQSDAPIGVAVGALALAVFIGRAVAVRRPPSAAPRHAPGDLARIWPREPGRRAAERASAGSARCLDAAHRLRASRWAVTGLTSVTGFSAATAIPLVAALGRENEKRYNLSLGWGTQPSMMGAR
jgi:hypothetical protein